MRKEEVPLPGNWPRERERANERNKERRGTSTLGTGGERERGRERRGKMRYLWESFATFSLSEVVEEIPDNTNLHKRLNSFTFGVKMTLEYPLRSNRSCSITHSPSYVTIQCTWFNYFLATRERCIHIRRQSPMFSSSPHTSSTPTW
eukprot:TRINITY_DN1017_c0_g1_i7.p2 TRINITY_DN1017_c0_g1~~TRINITY_DN1017_c0_g1_i7.p2  ORF type:complete len:147 (-),score=24.33 TRINITY_DN1017_c0_g1_i7:537-977(-)